MQVYRNLTAKKWLSVMLSAVTIPADRTLTIVNTGGGVLSLRNIRFIAAADGSPIVNTARISLLMRARAADGFHVLAPLTDEELSAHLDALANAPTEEPTQPAVEPTQPAVEPTQPAVDPTQPVVEPTQPAVEPTEPAAEPAQPDGNACAYCGKVHPKTFFGSLIRMFHMIAYFFKIVFGLGK